MGLIVDVTDIESRCRDRFEIDSDYVSVAVLTQWANDSIKALLDAVLSTPERHLLARVSQSIAVVSGTDIYPLPDDFVDLHRVEAQESGTDWRQLFPVNLSERGLDNLGLADKYDTGYILLERQLALAPVPAWSGNVRVWYTPAPPVLLNTAVSGATAGHLLHSQDLTKSQWTKVAAVIKPRVGWGPGNVANLDGIVGAATSAQHGVTQASTVTAVTWVFSCYARAGAQNFLYMADDTVTNCWCYFNVSTGVIGNKGAGVSKIAIEAVPGATGLYRCWMRFTGTAASHTFRLSAATTDPNAATPTFTGDNDTVDLYVGCVQTEAADYPTIYRQKTTEWDSIFGWDEWVLLDMGCKFAAKEEGDIAPLQQERGIKLAQILSRAKQRDSSGPSVVRNIAREKKAARFPYGRQA